MRVDWDEGKKGFHFTYLVVSADVGIFLGIFDGKIGRD
jgi:hypothetical protein